MKQLTPFKLVLFSILFASIGVTLWAFSRASTNAVLPVASSAKDALGVSAVGSFDNYEKWVGRNLKYRMQLFKYNLGTKSTTDAVTALKSRLAGNNGPFYNLKQYNAARSANKPPLTVIETIGMVPDDLKNAKATCGSVKCNVSNLDRGLNGEWDEFYRAIANDIVAKGLNTTWSDGRPKMVIRFGHEQNGAWYGWSANGAEAKYAALWRRAHDIMATIMGPNVLWEWNFSTGPSVTNAADSYPGDDYVDVVGLDFYDRKETGTFTCAYTSCPPFSTPSRAAADEQKAWTGLKSQINTMVSFATSKKKLFGVSEWGASVAKETNNQWSQGGNSAYFIEQAYNLLNNLTPAGSGSASQQRLAYAIYFERQSESSDAELGLKSYIKLSPGDDNTQIPATYGALEYTFDGVLNKTNFPNNGDTLGAAGKYIELFGGKETVPNQPPVVSAGTAKTVNLAETTYLEGQASDDGKPNNQLTTTWSKSSGPGTVTFDNPNLLNTKVSFSEAGIYVLKLTASDGQLSANDSVAITVTSAPASQYDLTITNIGFIGGTKYEGQPTVFTATIKNQGTTPTPDNIIHGVGFFVDDIQVSWSDTYSSSIAPGQSVTLTANSGPDDVDFWTAVLGSHSLKAWVDKPNRLPNESNEANNITTASITVLPNEPQPPTPDPDTTKPTISINTPSGSSQVKDNVTITATASDNIGVAHVEFKIDDNALTSDTTSPYATSWDSSSVADGKHTLTATAFDAAGNSSSDSVDITVNNAKPSKNGDINNDGKVNAQDLALLLIKWKESPTSNDRADINNDGKVNAQDLALLLIGWKR